MNEKSALPHTHTQTNACTHARAYTQRTHAHVRTLIVHPIQSLPHSHDATTALTLLKGIWTKKTMCSTLQLPPVTSRLQS